LFLPMYKNSPLKFQFSDSISVLLEFAEIYWKQKRSRACSILFLCTVKFSLAFTIRKFRIFFEAVWKTNWPNYYSWIFYSKQSAIIESSTFFTPVFSRLYFFPQFWNFIF
jgi:hypothetical protein